MHRWTATAALAVGSGLVLAIAAGAQKGQDPSACVNACYDAEDLCYQACSGEQDAAACQDACRRKVEACLAKCE